MKTIIIIPARFESSRFQGKPLALILGKTLIQRVWQQCCLALDPSDVYVATDDERIRNHCQESEIQVIMTSKDSLTGTDRVCQASRDLRADLIVNVQGDEPLIRPEDILKVIDAHNENPEFVHCGMCKIKSKEDFRNPSVPKVVCRSDNRLLYMSRAAIPTNKNLSFEKAFKQVCIYVFPKKALTAFGKYAKKTELEAIEDIEILRFFELGYEIEMVKVSESSIAVDFPEDIKRAEEAIRKHEKDNRNI